MGKVSSFQNNPEMDRFLTFIWNNQECEQPEVWREIKGTKGLYYISNYGRVLSINNYSMRILQQTPDRSGYLTITTSVDGATCGYRIHQLVADYFLFKPEKASVIHHLDGDKWNNSADNLVWLTTRQHGTAHTILNKMKG